MQVIGFIESVTINLSLLLQLSFVLDSKRKVNYDTKELKVFVFGLGKICARNPFILLVESNLIELTPLTTSDGVFGWIHFWMNFDGGFSDDNPNPLHVDDVESTHVDTGDHVMSDASDSPRNKV